MAAWRFKTLVTSNTNGFSILTGVFKKGDTFQAATVNQTTTGGVTFLTSGSINAYDANMELRVEQSREDGKILVPPLGETEPLTEEGERLINMSATKDGRYYCISGKGWDGEVIQLSPNEALTLTDVKGKRFFLAEDGISVNDINYERHQVIHFESIDTVVVKAGETPAIGVLFYKA